MGRILHRYRGAIPYLLLAPGLLWLFAFFIVPNVQMLLYSLAQGTFLQGFAAFARSSRRGAST